MIALSDLLRDKRTGEDQFGLLANDLDRAAHSLRRADSDLEMLGDSLSRYAPLCDALRARIAPVIAAINALEREHRAGKRIKDGADPEALIAAAQDLDQRRVA